MRRKVMDCLPASASFLAACWMHRKGGGDWLFYMLAAIFLMAYYTHTEAE